MAGDARARTHLCSPADARLLGAGCCRLRSLRSSRAALHPRLVVLAPDESPDEVFECLRVARKPGEGGPHLGRSGRVARKRQGAIRAQLRACALTRSPCWATSQAAALLSREAGKFLRETLLEPGNALSFTRWWHDGAALGPDGCAARTALTCARKQSDTCSRLRASSAPDARTFAGICLHHNPESGQVASGAPRTNDS